MEGRRGGREGGRVGGAEEWLEDDGEMGDGRWEDEKLNYHPPDPKFFLQNFKALSYLI